MLSRLLGIIYILMNRQTVTASELAQHFEVSTRTIYRDIDALGEAGIPVFATKGKYGGISLTEQFVLNKMIISQEEQNQILAALSSLKETGAEKEMKTLKKLGDFFNNTEPINWLAIDLSDWSGTRQMLYEQIRFAILTHRILQFDYYGQYHAMSRRTVAPVQLMFKEYTWYLRAYCMEKKAMRIFKLFRMKNLELSEDSFTPNDGWFQEVLKPYGKTGKEKTAVQLSVLSANTKTSQAENQAQQPETEIIVLIDKKEAYRIYDRFDDSEIQVLENGDFLVHLWYYLDDWVYGLILSFGASAKILSPIHAQEEIKKRIMQMEQRYQ